MPKRRDLIRMTEEELSAFLAGRRVMNIATHNHDGTIHLVAMWYGFTSDGRIGFETFSKSQKIQNLRRDKRITALVEAGDLYEELQGVELVGTAEVTEDPDVLMPIAMSVVDRYIGGNLAPEEREATAAMMARNRSAVVLNVEKTVTWDHTKLGGTY
jgi:PPOX class probable F420-dependent enzyme